MAVVNGQLKAVSGQPSAVSQAEAEKLNAESRSLTAQLEQLTTDHRQLTTSIPVPPKYKSSDFQSSTYWRLRGKLDVPKERWVSFPHCECEDQSLVIAWAGYDHLQLTKAFAAFFAEVQQTGGSEDPRLVALLGCILELNPRVKQWNNDVDPDFGYRLGDYFDDFVANEARTDN